MGVVEEIFAEFFRKLEEDGDIPEKIAKKIRISMQSGDNVTEEEINRIIVGSGNNVSENKNN